MALSADLSTSSCQFQGPHASSSWSQSPRCLSPRVLFHLRKSEYFLTGGASEDLMGGIPEGLGLAGIWAHPPHTYSSHAGWARPGHTEVCGRTRTRTDAYSVTVLEASRLGWRCRQGGLPLRLERKPLWLARVCPPARVLTPPPALRVPVLIPRLKDGHTVEGPPVLVPQVTLPWARAATAGPQVASAGSPIYAQGPAHS